MDTIVWRRKKIEVKTIPKGTILFRLVKEPENDTRGIPLEDGKRCITPNQNIFFYPEPFTGKLTWGNLPKSKSHWFDELKNIIVYEVTRDIKILWLLLPSKNTRGAKATERNFIKRCSKVSQGCLPKPRNAYDPCVSDTIVKKYPEIVGMMGIANADGIFLRKNMKRNRKMTQRVQKYMHFAKDANGANSTPELILHPLVRRPPKDVIVHEGDVLENNYKQIGVYNLQDEQALKNFMAKLHYNPDTFFYQR
jgi:hypothetical protein